MLRPASGDVAVLPAASAFEFTSSALLLSACADLSQELRIGGRVLRHIPARPVILRELRHHRTRRPTLTRATSHSAPTASTRTAEDQPRHRPDDRHRDDHQQPSPPWEQPNAGVVAAQHIDQSDHPRQPGPDQQSPRSRAAPDYRSASDPTTPRTHPLHPNRHQPPRMLSHPVRNGYTQFRGQLAGPGPGSSRFCESPKLNPISGLNCYS